MRRSFSATSPCSPRLSADRMQGRSRTPELDSIALFGTGAMGMIGYAMMRMRAARGRREES